MNRDVSASSTSTSGFSTPVASAKSRSPGGAARRTPRAALGDRCPELGHDAASIGRLAGGLRPIGERPSSTVRGSPSQRLDLADRRDRLARRLERRAARRPFESRSRCARAVGAHEEGRRASCDRWRPWSPVERRRIEDAEPRRLEPSAIVSRLGGPIAVRASRRSAARRLVAAVRNVVARRWTVSHCRLVAGLHAGTLRPPSRRGARPTRARARRRRARGRASVIVRPRGVRWMKPSWSRYGS